MPFDGVFFCSKRERIRSRERETERDARRREKKKKRAVVDSVSASLSLPLPVHYSPAVSAFSRSGLLNLKKAVHLVPLDTRETREASEERPRMAATRVDDADEEDAIELLAARRWLHRPAAAAEEVEKCRAATADMVLRFALYDWREKVEMSDLRRIDES